MAASEHLRRGETRPAIQRSIDALRIVSSAPNALLVPFIISTTASILTTLGDHTGAARLHGFLRDDWTRMVATVPAAIAAVHVSALAQGRDALGREAFERAEASTAGLATSIAIDQALAALTAIAAPAQGRLGEPPSGKTSLTPRQHQVLVQLAAGRTNKEIARSLGVAAKTVTHHLTAVYDALGVRGRSEATAWAFRAGLVE